MASYNILNSGRRGWSTQSWLLFIYSAVVTCALVVVVSKNRYDAVSADETPTALEISAASTAAAYTGETLPAEDVPAIGAETADGGFVSGAGEEESFDNPEIEWSVETLESQPVSKDDVVLVEKGDHFIGLLQKIGMEYAEANQAAESLKAAGYDVRGLRAGQKINIVKTVDEPSGGLLSVDKIVIAAGAGVRYVVTRNEDEQYVAEKEELELKTENRTAEGVINSSLAVAMQEAGVPATVIGNFINIFAYTVDFRSDVKKGDSFKVLFDRKVAPEGKVVKNGDILYAELNLGKDKIALYRYEDSKGGVDYYNDKGIVLKRALDRKPMEFRNARISSRFGWRRHPILKRRILHSGVDYAAPKGTKIYASADGVVRRAQWAGGYGRYVVIRHNSEFSTGYAHMNAFAKGIRPGVRVKQGQVIGYVGSTGRSTGPHLHFEVIKNGKKVDPLKVKAATGTNLAGNELARFKKEAAKIAAIAEGLKAYAANGTAEADNAAVAPVADANTDVAAAKNMPGEENGSEKTAAVLTGGVAPAAAAGLAVGHQAGNASAQTATTAADDSRATKTAANQLKTAGQTEATFVAN